MKANFFGISVDRDFVKTIPALQNPNPQSQIVIVILSIESATDL
jgi:hypothetical protein